MIRYSWRKYILVVAVVALSCLLGSIDETRAWTEPTLEALCSDKQLSLTKISTTRNLIHENRQASKVPCLEYAESLEQLDDILAAVQNGNVCDLGFVDKIRKYHESFIATSSNKASNIPRPLRHFFISLCFQISAECKMALINNLEYDTKDKLTAADYDEIRFLEAHGATLLDQDSEIKDFDDILLLSDLSTTTGLEEQMGESKLLVKVRTNKMMRKLVENCNKKFKPFYDKLILPLIKLSNLGYNYQGELLEREIKELRENKLVLRWYNIVQTCEAFRNIEIYEDPEPSELSGGVQALNFISREMAESLREKKVKTIEEEIQEEEEKKGSGLEIAYNPIASHNEDELWIKDQKELEMLVQKHKASVSEAARVRSRLLKKIVSKWKEMMFSNKVPVFASDLVKSSFSGHKVTKTTNVNDELVMMVDQAVREEEIESGEASADELDTPVAGLFSSSPARKVVSRAGPKQVVRNVAIPPRPKTIPFTKEGTKLSTRIRNFGNKFLPSRFDIFRHFFCFFSIILLIAAITITG